MEDNSKKIAKWLEDHTLFSISGMCLTIGVDPSNFLKQKALRKIPKKHQPKIEEILKEYGYE